MTFAKAQEEEVIDWELALKAKTIDWSKLQELAGSWVTCSIGQLSELIPRKEGRDFRPEDDKLAEIALIWNRRSKERAKIVLTELKQSLSKTVNQLKEEIALL